MSPYTEQVSGAETPGSEDSYAAKREQKQTKFSAVHSHDLNSSSDSSSNSNSNSNSINNSSSKLSDSIGTDPVTAREITMLEPGDATAGS